ncbi:MAG: hypothetical protein AB8C95_15130 [Phycisphaeraceae bacterium]
MKKKLNRMWRQATADKKKFGILVTMMAIGLLLWGRLMLLEDVPKIATADDPNAQQQGADTPDGEGVQTSDVLPTLPPLPSVEVAMSEDLTLDLFSFRHNRYKPVPSEDSLGTGVQSTGNADDDRKRELVESARSLRLQSVIQGNSPAIVINGEVLRVGDEIEGFEIVSFNANSVRLTREGLTFLLKMFTK